MARPSACLALLFHTSDRRVGTARTLMWCVAETACRARFSGGAGAAKSSDFGSHRCRALEGQFGGEDDGVLVAPRGFLCIGFSDNAGPATAVTKGLGALDLRCAPHTLQIIIKRLFFLMDTKTPSQRNPSVTEAFEKLRRLYLWIHTQEVTGEWLRP